MTEHVVSVPIINRRFLGGNADHSRGTDRDSNVPAVNDSKAQDGADPVPGTDDDGETFPEAGQAACLPCQRPCCGIRIPEPREKSKPAPQPAGRVAAPLPARHIQHEAPRGIAEIAAHRSGQAVADVVLRHDELRNALKAPRLVLPDPFDGVQRAFPGQEASRAFRNDPVLALLLQPGALLEKAFVLPVNRPA